MAYTALDPAPLAPVEVLQAGLPGDVAELAGVEVVERLRDLRLGVHHERPAHRDRLADWLAAVDHDRARLVPVAGRQGDHRPVACGTGSDQAICPALTARPATVTSPDRT